MASHSHAHNYRPDIDGLRAVAVLAVLFFHAFPKSLAGGFIGVDVFFVISGYLISGIIFSAHAQNRFSFADFYARRIRRIFPALITVLIACAAFGWFVLLPNEWVQLGKHLLSGIGFSANFVLWHEAGYFDTAAKAKPLLHLWSLGIEEQFYLAWPLLLAAAWKFRARMITMILLIVAGSFTLNIFQSRAFDVTAFYSPLTRFWELLAGAVLSFHVMHHPAFLKQHQNARAIMGAILMIAGLFFIHASSTFPGWWALLPVIGALLLIASPGAWINRRLLSNPAAVMIGFISYPLYLFHWPLFSFAHILYGEIAPALRWGLLLISALLAYLTYRFIEKPMRFNMKHAIRYLIAGGIMIAVLGFAIWQNLIPPRHHNEQIGKVVEASADWEKLDDLFPFFKINNHKFYERRGSGQKILFWGDSHLEQYAPRIDELLKTNDALVIFATRGGCVAGTRAFDDEHPDCPEKMQLARDMAAQDDISTVVIGACWNCYFVEGAKDNAPLEYYYDDGTRRVPFQSGGLQLALNDLARQIRELSVHKKVFLVLDSPSGGQLNPLNFFTGSRLGELTLTQAATTLHYPDDAEALRKKLRELGEANGAVVIDPVDYLCRSQACDIFTETGAPIYKDGDHLRASWVRINADFMDKTLQASD